MLPAFSSGTLFRTLVANKSQYETQVTGDEVQGTMGSWKKRGLLSLSRRPFCINRYKANEAEKKKTVRQQED